MLPRSVTKTRRSTTQRTPIATSVLAAGARRRSLTSPCAAHYGEKKDWNSVEKLAWRVDEAHATASHPRCSSPGATVVLGRSYVQTKTGATANRSTAR